jgi:hypothetical protein
MPQPPNGCGVWRSRPACATSSSAELAARELKERLNLARLASIAATLIGTSIVKFSR